jgi:alkyl hydroperoxide reductase subunit D
MAGLVAISEAAATDKVAQTYGRLKDLFGDGPIPEPFLVYANVPSFLQDFYMNFKKFVWSEGALDVPTKAMISLAVAAVMKCRVWADYHSERLSALGLPPATAADVIGIASTCVMYNAFFKFRDIAGSAVFEGMSVGLRAHAFAGTSLSDKVVELINIAVSDLNGCKPCTSGHVEKARQLGLSDEAILEAVQCAATVAAGCAFTNAA